MGARHRPIRVLAFMEAYVVNGAAKTLLNFCDSLRRVEPQLIEVAIATFCRGSEPIANEPNEFITAARARGIRTFVIPERRAFDVAVISAMRRIAHEFAPDIVETNNVKSHFLVRVAGLNRGRPWIAVHHGYTATDSKIQFLNKLDRFSLPAADCVVLVCDAFRAQLADNRVRYKKVQIVHNSAAPVYQLPDTALLRQQHNIQEGSKVFVAIGRLSYEKGHSDLMDALRIVKCTTPTLRWKLLVVGSGPEQEALMKRCQESGLGGDIVFTGQQRDILPCLALADAMILPSHSEGSPHVVLEAMAACVPIIATRVGGVPEILNDDIAELVPARNPEALATAIVRTAANDELAREKARGARRILEEKFSHDAHRENMIRLFESVLGRDA